MELKLLPLFLLVWTLSGVVAPPVIHNNKTENDVDTKENEVPNDDFGVEYDRYLKEVVQALESDPQFRDKLQKAEDADIRSGKIAHELEYVSHAVRTRLDEVKRTEMERLRKYARKAYELQQGLDTEHLGIHSAPDPEHIDHANPETFEVEDLRRLIFKTTSDLAAADKKRREEFKEYEMQKEFEKHEVVKNMTEDEKKKYEIKVQQLETKHKEHAPLHHPISKPQLEEVWEKGDHMENQQFDPKTFFYLHDLDGNGMWDFDEVKALFLKELDKMYQAGAPEDDMRERMEEMERMREHVFQEADSNRDGLISYEEFLAQTQKSDFNSDPGWETLDQQQQYTREEYEKFEMQRQHEIEAMIANGHLPPHAADTNYGGHPQQQHQAYPQHPQQGHPQQYQAPPQQFQGHQQFQGQQQQYQVPPQQFQGHQQYQGQGQGQPQFHGQPQQYHGQQQQFQPPPRQIHPPPPQPIHNQPQQSQGQPQGHIASQQAASLHQSGQASPEAVHSQQQQPPQAQHQFQAQPQAVHSQQQQPPPQAQQQFQAQPQAVHSQQQHPPPQAQHQFQAQPQAVPNSQQQQMHQQQPQANIGQAAQLNTNNALNNQGQPSQAVKQV